MEKIATGRVKGMSVVSLVRVAQEDEQGIFESVRRAVELAVMGRLNDVLQSKTYQGIFLDRMRYPSPAPDPLRNLGCFCPACR